MGRVAQTNKGPAGLASIGIAAVDTGMGCMMCKERKLMPSQDGHF